MNGTYNKNERETTTHIHTHTPTKDFQFRTKYILLQEHNGYECHLQDNKNI